MATVILVDATVDGGSVTIIGTVDGVDTAVVLPAAPFSGLTKAQRQNVAGLALKTVAANSTKSTIPLSGTVVV